MKKVQHEKSATWKRCNMKKVYSENECNMTNVQHEKIVT